ncbi:MAG TPA: T9SS type A sorting domain-containing protein [Chitinophagales bacterium]|nr:T9SS type A sorting domain-containing protein [Chitinophagales bacterium]
MIRFFLSAIFLIPVCCFSQYTTFQQVLNFNSSSTEGDIIISTSDGGYALSGVANIGGNAEAFLSKYNSSGENEWTKIYYDQQSHLLLNGVDDTEIICNQYVRFLAEFDDGYVLGGGIDSAVFITYSNGVTVGSDYNRMYAIHTDANGNLLWAKKFIANDNTFGEDAMSTADGSLLLGGSVTQPGFVLRDIALWKLNADGDVLWAQSYGGSFDEGVAHVIETSPSQWMVCGVSESFSNNQNIYIISTDSDGQLNWSNVYGTTGFDYGKGIVKMNDGYYVFGNAGNGSPSYIALMKIDTTGILQWANTYGNFLFDSPTDLFATPNGNLIMLADHNVMSHDALACEVDADGNLMDSRIFGNTNANKNDFITSLIPSGIGFLTAGYTNSFSGNQFFYQAYLIKTHDGLESDCFSESISYAPTALTLTTSSAATAVATLNATGHEMFVTVLDSSLIADTLCFSVASNVTTPEEQTSLFIFPNPADDEMIIKSSLPVVQVNCFNQLGEMIFSEDEKYASEIQLHTSDLCGGIYFLEIITAREISYHKIIVVH